MAFRRACSDDEIWEGEMVEVDIGAHPIVLMRIEGGELRAYQGMCPHQDIPLAEGRFNGKVLMCRAHQWIFDACTGNGINPGDCRLASYPVRVQDGDVLVEVDGIVPVFAHS